MNNNEKINLRFNKLHDCFNCAFTLQGDFILYSKVYNGKKAIKIIWVYSTQTKDNNWTCKGIYKIPFDVRLISISKYDKLYLFSNHYFYQWDIVTGKSLRLIENINDESEVTNIKYSIKTI